MHHDPFDGPASSRSTDARRAYRDALRGLHTGRGDPLRSIDAALHADPDFVAAYCLRAGLLVMDASETSFDALARTLAAARSVGGRRISRRARRHLDAASAWLARDLRRALGLYARIVDDHPEDTLALRIAHLGDLQWGRTARLRDRIAAVLPRWNGRVDGYDHLLGMYAFGLAETGDARHAERVGRDALAIDPYNACATHAVAHALEAEGRSEEGIEWLVATRHHWEGSARYASHLWWHLALFHLDRGDAAAALAIHDRHLAGARGGVRSGLLDASSLLWRLALVGTEPGSRWAALADRWARAEYCGLRPFADVHAMLAFAGAGRRAEARRLTGRLLGTAARCADLRPVVAERALPVCAALEAFGEGRYAEAAEGLDALRRLPPGCGGSHAQCDLLGLTLLEARLRGGRRQAARALAAERVARRPGSVAALRLLSRAAAPDGAAAVAAEGAR